MPVDVAYKAQLYNDVLTGSVISCSQYLFL